MWNRAEPGGTGALTCTFTQRQGCTNMHARHGAPRILRYIPRYRIIETGQVPARFLSPFIGADEERASVVVAAQDEDEGDRRGKDRHPLRTFRADDELWRAAQATARARGESVSAVIRRGLRAYVRRHNEELPERRRGPA